MKKRNHRWYLAAALGAALACSGAITVCASGAEHVQVYVGSGYQHQWSDQTNRIIAESEYAQVGLDEKTAEAYPNLQAALNQLSEKKKAAADETFASLLTDAENILKERPDFDGELTDKEKDYVQRADTHYVSLLGYYTGYLGGAHGYYGYRGVTYDTSTGEEVKLSDLVTDTDSFISLVKDQIVSSYSEVETETLENYFASTALDDMSWTAGWTGISCYFDPYLLGPYAIGSQTVLIPYSGNESLFTEAVKDVPESYGTEFPLGVDTLIGDHKICVYGNLSEYDAIEKISIFLDGQEYAFDGFYYYSISPTYLRAGEKEYLYLECVSDNDYRVTEIFEISDSVTYLGNADLGRIGIVDTSSYTAKYAALTNPSNLPLDTRISILSTVSGSKTFFVGADGKPETNDKYYVLDPAFPRLLTLKTELNCEEVDEDGNSIGALTLPAGTQLTYYRTDNESVVDLTFDEGRIARVTVVHDKWPQTIDGTNIEDIFDGILFAG